MSDSSPSSTHIDGATLTELLSHLINLARLRQVPYVTSLLTLVVFQDPGYHDASYKASQYLRDLLGIVKTISKMNGRNSTEDPPFATPVSKDTNLVEASAAVKLINAFFELVRGTGWSLEVAENELALSGFWTQEKTEQIVEATYRALANAIAHYKMMKDLERAANKAKEGVIAG